MPRDGKLSCAVIGGGAAGHGALLGLKNSGMPLRVTLIDPPEGPKSPYEPDYYPQAQAPERAAYLRHLRACLGRSLLPAKSHFGIAPETYEVANWGRIWRSDSAGGLTRFWGASALPLPQQEFAAWPFGLEELRSHYAAIVADVPVAGDDDALSALWGHGLASRPALRRLEIFDRLSTALQTPNPKQHSFDLVAGGGRMAIETAADADSTCRYCGDCMAGCRFGSIYSAGSALAGRQDLYDERIAARVLAVNSVDRTVTVEWAGEQQSLGPFDRIYLAAGCVGSTAILARSGLAPRETEMQDNTVLSFLLISHGPRPPNKIDAGYYALTNMVVACCPRQKSARMAAIQLYPFFDYLWEMHAPRLLWPSLRAASRRLRARLAIARLYLPAAMSQRYSLQVPDCGPPVFALTAPPAEPEELAPLWQSVRAGLGRGGFKVLPRPLIRHGTSSHYAGTLPLGGEHVDAEGRIAPGVYLCDSAAFPESPAFSPTLTIMAFAHRVAKRSVAESAPIY